MGELRICADHRSVPMVAIAQMAYMSSYIDSEDYTCMIDPTLSMLNCRANIPTGTIVNTAVCKQ